MMSKIDLNGLVYSSEHGKMCPLCAKAIAACVCRRNAPRPGGDGVVRVFRETKGRKGKGVTVISGIPLEADALKHFAKMLKKKCGTGGTVKAGTVEIQGDHRELLMDLLKKEAWQVKGSSA